MLIVTNLYITFKSGLCISIETLQCIVGPCQNVAFSPRYKSMLKLNLINVGIQILDILERWCSLIVKLKLQLVIFYRSKIANAEVRCGRCLIRRKMTSITLVYILTLQ